ncbi:MAG: ABC transporter substrate-binding protein, partial [Spirochaetales bacterium]
MRKLFTVFVVLLIAAAAFATGTQEETIRIGISKIVSHPALDAVEQGIKDELAELGYTDIVFDVQSANGDISTANQIATKFRNDRVDVAVGIATPTAQALVNAITDIPVVYTAVTDPVGAGIVPSLEGDGGNVTGYSDLTPVREQIGLIGQLDGVSAIGHVYSSGEANAVVLAEMAAEAAEEIGVEFLTTTVTNTAEVRQATESIVDRVDIFYMSTDNTVVSALAALTEVANAAGVPVMTADP